MSYSYPVTTQNKGVSSTTLIYSPQELHLPSNYTEQGGNKHYLLCSNTKEHYLHCNNNRERYCYQKKKKVLITQYICPDI